MHLKVERTFDLHDFNGFTSEAYMSNGIDGNDTIHNVSVTNNFICTIDIHKGTTPYTYHHLTECGERYTVSDTMSDRLAVDEKIRISTTTAIGTGVDNSNDDEEMNDELSSYSSNADKHDTEATNGTDSSIFDGSCITRSASNISAVSVSGCIIVIHKIVRRHFFSKNPITYCYLGSINISSIRISIESSISMASLNVGKSSFSMAHPDIETVDIGCNLSTQVITRSIHPSPRTTTDKPTANPTINYMDFNNIIRLGYAPVN